jgi:hypothetical protein
MSIVVSTLEGVSGRPRFPYICHRATTCFGVLLLTCMNAFAANYYVNYSGGADSNAGTSTAAAWKHCPGDPSATGNPAATSLAAGDTVFFKGGVSYVLNATNPNPVLRAAGIALNWNGAGNNRITYDGNSAGTWGTGKAVLTDNYTSNNICAFYVAGSISNINFNGFEIGPIGGSATLPSDPGYAVPAKPGGGIVTGGSMNNVIIANCYFHSLGYWFYQQPMSLNSRAGTGVECWNSSGLTITNCEFTDMTNPIELPTTVSTTNLVITACNFHDNITWAIDFPGISGTRDAVFIHDNVFHDWDRAYTNWSGYGEEPHHDGIFDRSSTLAFLDGTNINIYNNFFYDSSPTNTIGTACIYLSGTTSANIYNNVFDNVQEGNAAIYIYHASSVVTHSLARIYNNTFYLHYVFAILVYNGEPGQPFPDVYGTWLPGDVVDVKNNVFYDTMKGTANNYVFGMVSTNSPLNNISLLLDYNCYQTSNTLREFFDQYQGTTLDLAGVRSYGWEIHGQTNDPHFVNLSYGTTANSYLNDYHLQTNSPCIGAGVNLSSLNLPGLNADKDGKPRPALGPWTAGAFQSAESLPNRLRIFQVK